MRQAAGLRARLVLQVVGTIGATAHDFSGRGEPEPLLGAAVCLHLRHVAASLVPGVLTARVLSRPADDRGQAGTSSFSGWLGLLVSLRPLLRPRPARPTSAGASEPRLPRRACRPARAAPRAWERRGRPPPPAGPAVGGGGPGRPAPRPARLP